MSGTYVDWPFGCPRSWTERNNPALIRTEMEQGYPKVRRMFTKDWKTFEGSWPLRTTQTAAFRNFVSISCQGGALPFRMEDPLVPGTTRLYRFIEPPSQSTDVSEMPMSTVTARLEEVFS
jgi:hypothetical protein